MLNRLRLHEAEQAARSTPTRGLNYAYFSRLTGETDRILNARIASWKHENPAGVATVREQE